VSAWPSPQSTCVLPDAVTVTSTTMIPRSTEWVTGPYSSSWLVTRYAGIPVKAYPGGTSSVGRGS
jgi:hypothetical protein